MRNGYMLDFTNRTFEEFVFESTGRNSYGWRIQGFGSSEVI